MQSIQKLFVIGFVMLLQQGCTVLGNSISNKIDVKEYRSDSNKAGSDIRFKVVDLTDHQPLYLSLLCANNVCITYSSTNDSVVIKPVKYRFSATYVGYQKFKSSAVRIIPGYDYEITLYLKPEDLALH